MDDKVIRIPITYDQRKRNEMGEGYVPCQISNRWLQFPKTVDKQSGWIFVDVMTLDSNNEPKKLCQLLLSVEDISNALKSIEVI